MELNDLKQVWDSVKTPPKPAADMQLLLSENNHPVLKGIKRQLVVEIAAWLIFLCCYYTAFDGYGKPVWVNAVLIVSVLMSLIQNISGYRMAKYMVSNGNIKQSLEKYLLKMKIYVKISIISRISLMSSVLLFFTYGLQLTGKRYIVITIIALCFLIQVFILNKLWLTRIKKLKNTLTTFGA